MEEEKEEQVQAKPRGNVNLVSRNSWTPDWCLAVGVPSQTLFISGHLCERVTRICT